MLERVSQRLKSAEDRLGTVERKLANMEGELKKLAQHRHPEYAEGKTVKGLSEAQKQLVERVARVERGLGELARKCEALSGAVGKVPPHTHKNMADDQEVDRLRQLVNQLETRQLKLEQSFQALVEALTERRIIKVRG